MTRLNVVPLIESLRPSHSNVLQAPGSRCLLFLPLQSLAREPVAAPRIAAHRSRAGFAIPLFVAAPPGDASRLFIVQEDGQIRIIDLATGTVKSDAVSRSSQDVVALHGERRIARSCL